MQTYPIALPLNLSNFSSSLVRGTTRRSGAGDLKVGMESPREVDPRRFGVGGIARDMMDTWEKADEKFGEKTRRNLRRRILAPVDLGSATSLHLSIPTATL